MKPSIKRNAGFTLIELMIVVAIIGILSMLAMTGYKGYMASAKAGEAKSSLGSIGKLALTSYEKESGGTTTAIVAAAGAGAAANQKQFCASQGAGAAGYVPSTLVPAGVKYQATDPMWRATVGAGFGCLGFSMTGAQYFAYGYFANNATALSAAGGPTFSAYAVGDLNGNNAAAAATIEAIPAIATGNGNSANNSTYAINGGTSQLVGATLAPTMIEINPTE